MKKIIKILPAFVFVFVVLLLGGCTLSKLSTPTDLTTLGPVISWSEVKEANGYRVSIDGEYVDLYEKSNCSLNLLPYITANGKNNDISEVKVKAFSNNRFVGDSDYSESISINISKTNVLTMPTNFSLSLENNNYVFNWDPVENATGYCLRIRSESEQAGYEYNYTTTNNLSILENAISLNGTLYASVLAYSNNLRDYAPSAASEEIEFSLSLTLGTPTNIKVSNNHNEFTVRWNRVENTDSYRVCVTQGNKLAIFGTSSNSFSFTLPDYTAGEMLMFSVQAISPNLSLYKDSYYSGNYSYIDTSASKSTIRNVNYNFMGKTFDLVADNDEEFKTIFRYYTYYRANTVYFFADSKPSNETIKNMVKNFSEILSFNFNRYYTCSNGMYAFEITQYNNPVYPEKIAEGEYVCEQLNDVVPTNYSKTGRAENFEDFAINQRTLTAPVFNSEQLFFAVEYGYKPVFPSSSCPASIAYEYAKTILREICDDTMSDYDKALAIFEWLCFNVKYDHNLLTLYNNATTDNDTIELYNYRAFYIEGVFFDGGQAVCDGIAKTYALLCNMEGITCVKINGEANGGGHAWNKIKLDMNNDGATEWYVVDATWNDWSQTQQTTYTEILNHQYWLLTDDVITNGCDHTETDPTEYLGVATTSFDYYEYTKYDGVNSLNVEQTATAIENVCKYLKNNPEVKQFEFKTKLTTAAINYYFAQHGIEVKKLLHTPDLVEPVHHSIYILYR